MPVILPNLPQARVLARRRPRQYLQLTKAAGSDEVAPSKPRTRPRNIKLIVDEKRHPEQPNKAQNAPKPIWTEEKLRSVDNSARDEGSRSPSGSGRALCRGFCLTTTDPLPVARLRLSSN